MHQCCYSRLPLRDIVVFPHMVAPLFVGRVKSVNALAEAMEKDKKVFLATQKKAGVDDPVVKDMGPWGRLEPFSNCFGYRTER